MLYQGEFSAQWWKWWESDEGDESDESYVSGDNDESDVKLGDPKQRGLDRIPSARYSEDCNLPTDGKLIEIG